MGKLFSKNSKDQDQARDKENDFNRKRLKDFQCAALTGLLANNHTPMNVHETAFEIAERMNDLVLVKEENEKKLIDKAELV